MTTTLPTIPTPDATWTTETVPASNWSGSQLEIRVNVERTAFTLYDYRFELVKIEDAEITDGQAWRIMGSAWSSPLGTVAEDYRPDVAAWAFDHAAELVREDRDRVRAAVKLLANLI